MANLATSTWPQIGQHDVVLIPLGSTEQHGPHLPFDTDTVIAVAVAEELCHVLEQSSISALVSPALPIGSSGEHQGFPGTISMGNDALRLVIIELARSVKTWAPRVVFVNGHGGNAPVLSDAVKQLVHEGHIASWVSCGLPGQDAHAGREETSVMLHLVPGSVNMTAAQPGVTESLTELLPVLMKEGVRAVSPNGVLGDPTGATAEEGIALLSTMVSNAGESVRRFVAEC
jgi:creatinine amidohydrolase